MPKTPILTLNAKDFIRGMGPVGVSGAFSTFYGCDIHSKPGQIRTQTALVADDDTIFQTNSDYPVWFKSYDQNNGTEELYAYGKSDRLYRRTGGAWAQIRNITPNAEGQGLEHFQTSLYYSTRGGIGKLTGDPTVGGNYTDNFKSFTSDVSSSGFAPMKKFAGSLYIGNNRYISKLDADETSWTQKALTLPVGFVVSALEEWNDRLIIATKSGIQTTEERVFIWDGISEFPEQIIKVPKPGASCIFNYNNALKAFIGRSLYHFNGSDFITELQFPKTGLPSELRAPTVYPNAVELFDERMIFGVSEDQLANDTQFLSGIYGYGKSDERFPNALTFDFPISTGVSSELRITAIATFNTVNDRPVLYVGSYDVGNSLYAVDVLDYSERNANAYFVTNVLELDGNYGRLIEGVRVEFEGLMSDNNAINKVVVKYRTDGDIEYDNDTTNFTTLGTIDRDTSGNNNYDEVLSGIYERARKIQFKFEILSDGSNVDDNLGITRIHIY